MPITTIAAMSMALTLSMRLNSYPSPRCHYGDALLTKNLGGSGSSQKSERKTRSKVCQVEVILHRPYGERTLLGINRLLTVGIPTI